MFVQCRELLSLSTLRSHPHVVGLQEAYVTPHHLAIVMELAGAFFFVQAVQLFTVLSMEAGHCHANHFPQRPLLSGTPLQCLALGTAAAAQSQQFCH